MKGRIQNFRRKTYQLLANFIYAQLQAALDIERITGKSFKAFDMWMGLGQKLDFVAKEHDIYLD